MANELQDLRRSAVVSGFGPGAIVDFRADGAPVSAMTAGLEAWDASFPPAGLANPQTVREPRLQKKLGVHGFRLPPVSEQRTGSDEPDMRRLIGVRFPQWLQCPQCDTVAPARLWSDDPGKAYRYCARCTGRSPGGRRVFAIPVRFVLACPAGHVDEFPWHWWVNHAPGCANRNGALVLKSDSAGLAGLKLSCGRCHAVRSMDGVFSKQTWAQFADCAGRRPWLADADQRCCEKPLAVQRGASNLYFAVTQSALSIPPWTDRLQQAIGAWWETLVALQPVEREPFIAMMAKGELGPVLARLGMTPSALAEAVARRIDHWAGIDAGDLRPAEFRQFLEDAGDRADGDLDFETRREPVPPALSPWISHVVRAVRLREVRALTGFTRITPPGDPDSADHARLSARPLSWLPAIEVRGEGVFLALDETRLSAWEARPDVRARAARCDELHRADWTARFGPDAPPPRPVTARYLLCHTLAHVLMRQLTLECGYSAASLQERIYASDDEAPMAGVLVYTATPDADGTLGGLERQGRAGRIAGILTRALAAVEWCSSDPLCISDMMGAGAAFSIAACHACVLAPETACETFNRFLDRSLLIGTPEDPEAGFFSDLARVG